MDQTGQVPGTVFSEITRKLNTAKFDKKHAFWSRHIVELEECAENLKTLDPIRKELTEWDRKNVKSIVVVGDCFNWGRIQGAATAANAAPRNGLHQFPELSFRF